MAVIASRQTTPPEPINGQVRNFCWSLSHKKPVFLLFTAVDNCYISGHCHLNVKHRIRECGGRRVYGWVIWQQGRMIEAEFHCAWETPDGQLLDITPRADGEERVLFVPDPKRKIEQHPDGDIIFSNRTPSPMAPFILNGKPGPETAVVVRRLRPSRTLRLLEALGMPPDESYGD